MAKINPNILILGEYINAKTPIRVKCLIDGYEWSPTPDSLLQGNGCGVCSNKIILKGVNDLWTTDSKIANMLINPEEGYLYCRNSQKKLKFKCPNCGSVKEIAPYVVYTYGLGCRVCSDGISYPEKVIRSVLLQSDVLFCPEYSPTWIKPRRYDFYLPDYNVIIETNGRQHYDNAFGTDGSASVEEIQANDKEKHNLAINNGIDDVIFVNCCFSEIEYIKQSITSDERLQLIINFDVIDWREVDLSSQKSILIEVCEKWDKSEVYEPDRVRQLSVEYKVSTTTIRSYLRRGTELGLCNYNGKNYIRLRKGGAAKKKVYELDLNFNIINVYKSYTEVRSKIIHKFTKITIGIMKRSIIY